MNTKRGIPLAVLFVLGTAAACASGVSDDDLIGTWINDDDSSITLTITKNTATAGPGLPGATSSSSSSEFVGRLIGSFSSPDTPTGPLTVDVRRDALNKPLFVVPSYSGLGYKDILCEGCDVDSTTGKMECDYASVEAYGATGTKHPMARNCHWTRQGGGTSGGGADASTQNDGGSEAASSGCSYPAVGSYCGSTSGCGTFPVTCPTITCPPNATCSGSGCACDTGYAPVCCDGTPCKQSGCTDCPSSGGYPSNICVPWPMTCTDDISQTSGTCVCSDGRNLSYSCGTSGTCQQLCGG